MKRIIKSIISFSSALLLITSVCYAQDTTTTTTDMTTTNKMWKCTTNASSAPSGSVEEKADKDLENNASSAADAFSMALKHCRDCTKITCKVQ